MSEFQSFPKIARYENLDVVLTEKIDGTNGCLVWTEDGEFFVQSRNRIIMPGKNTDNAGFAAWAYEHHDELLDFFGVGRHYGEWYGKGIAHGYKLDKRYFAPFNTARWNYQTVGDADWPEDVRPVPVLDTVPLPEIDDELAYWETELKVSGSRVTPEFVVPEGIMAYCDGFRGGYLKFPFNRVPKGVWKDRGREKRN